MNIRYRFRLISTGELITRIMSLEEIEASTHYLLDPNKQIISRDLGTGLKAIDQKEMFERDQIVSDAGEVGVIGFSDGAFWMEYLPPHNWDPMAPAELLGTHSYEIIGRSEKEGE
jgi:hypothetical protein